MKKKIKKKEENKKYKKQWTKRVTVLCNIVIACGFFLSQHVFPVE